MRKIVMTTDDLVKLLQATKDYKHFIVYDGDYNTDGEGVWHCDVELTDTLDESYYDTSDEMFSFNEAKE